MMGYALFANGRIIDRHREAEHWDDPTFLLMYPGMVVVRTYLPVK